MKSYKIFLYGLVLVSCISGSIFAKGGHKSGSTTVTLHAPSDGNFYALYKWSYPFDKDNLSYLGTEYTYKPKTDDAQWYQLVVLKNDVEAVTKGRLATDFKNKRYWDWTVDANGKETLTSH